MASLSESANKVSSLVMTLGVRLLFSSAVRAKQHHFGLEGLQAGPFCRLLAGVEASSLVLLVKSGH